MATYNDPTVNLDNCDDRSALEKLLGSRRVDSHSLLGGSTEFMLKNKQNTCSSKKGHKSYDLGGKGFARIRL